MELVSLFLTLFNVYGILTLPTTDNNENNELSALKDQVTALTKQLKDLENDTGRRLENLETTACQTNTSAVNRALRATYPTAVGFTVKVSKKLYSLPIGTTIIYDYVYYNAGSGYDDTTGVFTCPRSGIYLFAIFVESFTATTAAIDIVIDGSTDTVAAVSEPYQDGQDDTGGNIRIAHLLEGQRVWVRTYDSDNQNIYPHFTTFSGVLIQST